MFTPLGLFHNTRCPDRLHCKRPRCLFSHKPDLPPDPVLNIPVHVPIQPLPQPSVPAKRSAPLPNGAPSAESSRKLQKLGPARQSAPPPPASSSVPTLKIAPAQSSVAIPVRQTLLKSLYDHFVVLYEKILPANPTLASEHSLRQEEEVYKKSTKLTYRNAVIFCIASIKRRPVPDSVAHESVGTEGDLAVRAETKKSLAALRLTPAHLESHVLSVEDMTLWNYVVEIPSAVGGDMPSEEGKIMRCDRCRQPFQVKRQEDAEECLYHWGRPYSAKRNGERVRVYACCSQPTSSPDGCTRGVHVFSETEPEDLHRRHAFSHTRSPTSDDDALEVAALDCEMIYTTGGMRVARVSVVDGLGSQVFDELVRMDDNVHVIDFNTRFSGINSESYSAAVLPLSAIRKALDALINSNTILIGHGLENDLKTLRMIHHRNVDTAILFRHPSGHPYRRALRDLAKEHLGQLIQTGGADLGHSSVEDSIATLNLVRWYILNKPSPPPQKEKLASNPTSNRPPPQSQEDDIVLIY